MRVKAWTAPLALAVAIAAVIGGTAWLAHGRGSPATTGTGRPPMLRLASDNTASSAGRALGLAQGLPAAATPAGGRPYVLAGTLPAGKPGRQPVYRLRPTTPTAAARVADALGIKGRLTAIAGGWAARSGDNVLIIRTDGTWSLAMDCFRQGPVSSERTDVGCAVATGPATVSAPTASGAGSTRPSDAPRPWTPPAGPSPAAARSAAEPVLAALGLSGAPLTVTPQAPTTSVTAQPIVSGTPTSGLSTTLSIARDGTVATASGRVLELSAGDRYPVITARAAFDRLQSQPIAMPEICMLRKDGKPGCAPIPRPRITGAHLGLMPDVDGTRPVLVPAWLFTVAGSADPITELAVDPEFLAAPPTPHPVPLNGGGVAPAPPVTAAPGPPITAAPTSPR